MSATTLQKAIHIKSFVKGKWCDLAWHERKCKSLSKILLKLAESLLETLLKKQQSSASGKREILKANVEWYKNSRLVQITFHRNAFRFIFLETFLVSLNSVISLAILPMTCLNINFKNVAFKTVLQTFTDISAWWPKEQFWSKIQIV